MAAQSLKYSVAGMLGTDGSILPWLDVLRLKFFDPELEREFRLQYAERSVPIVRLSILLGMLLVGGFAVLDLWIIERGISTVWWIRFAVVCPALFALYLLTYWQHFRRHMQTAVAAAMLVVGFGVIAMTGVIDQPGSYLYYGGVLDTIIYCCCIMRLQFLRAVAVSVVLFAVYQSTALVLNPIPDWALINNNFFLVTAIGVGSFAAYVQEFYLRVAYFNHNLLLRETRRSSQLLAEAQAASKAKSEFLAMVSHELRTPLNAIIGFSEMMSQETFGPLGDGRYTAYAEDIHSSGTHLLGIINDILDLSKVEAGRLQVSDEMVNVGSVAKSVARLCRSTDAADGLEVTTSIDENVPLIRGDRSLITRVVMNLTSNAIKFSKPGGEVGVSVYLDRSGDLVLSVSDQGIGIAPHDLERVMEPFLQADGSLAREHQGTGLGLPLAKKMMELHGGSLDIASELGKGTVVSAHFPAERFADPTLHAAAE